jgi:hypothetical protein
MRHLLVVLAAVILPTVPLSGSEGAGAKRPASESALLQPTGPKELTYCAWKDAGIETILDAAAGEDAEERQRALAKLPAIGLRAAIQARLREIVEKDSARRERFVAAESAATSDRAAVGDALVAAADALATCGTNSGPRAKEFGTDQLALARNRAKVLHCFFVRADVYADTIDQQEFENTDMTVPYRDLPAASELYALAATAYEAAAGGTKDVEQVRVCTAKAVSARAEAAKAKQRGATSN